MLNLRNRTEHLANLALAWQRRAAEAHYQAEVAMGLGLRKMAIGFQQDSANFSCAARRYLFELIGAAPEHLP